MGGWEGERRVRIEGEGEGEGMEPVARGVYPWVFRSCSSDDDDAKEEEDEEAEAWSRWKWVVVEAGT